MPSKLTAELPEAEWAIIYLQSDNHVPSVPNRFERALNAMHSDARLAVERAHKAGKQLLTKIYRLLIVFEHGQTRTKLSEETGRELTYSQFHAAFGLHSAFENQIEYVQLASSP